MGEITRAIRCDKIAAHELLNKSIINLNDELSLSASKLSIEFKLPMADSIIYATTLKYNCVLWTQDRHFSGLDFVNYFEKN
ncbi:MAG: PIN domain-containing protein [Spirochaetaceae bacterium]|nr:PIN domain-containing protein [Spirochaetaceae bacterium]